MCVCVCVFVSVCKMCAQVLNEGQVFGAAHADASALGMSSADETDRAREQDGVVLVVEGRITRKRWVNTGLLRPSALRR